VVVILASEGRNLGDQLRMDRNCWLMNQFINDSPIVFLKLETDEEEVKTEVDDLHVTF